MALVEEEASNTSVVTRVELWRWASNAFEKRPSKVYTLICISKFADVFLREVLSEIYIPQLEYQEQVSAYVSFETKLNLYVFYTCALASKCP